MFLIVAFLVIAMASSMALPQEEKDEIDAKVRRFGNRFLLCVVVFFILLTLNAMYQFPESFGL